jgi:hypothetical protein
VLLTLLNVIDYGMNVQEAVDAPRFHQQWMPNPTSVEPFALSPDTRRILEGMGHVFAPPRQANHMAAILIGAPALGAPPVGGNRLYGANDPRATPAWRPGTDAHGRRRGGAALAGCPARDRGRVAAARRAAESPIERYLDPARLETERRLLRRLPHCGRPRRARRCRRRLVRDLAARRAAARDTRRRRRAARLHQRLPAPRRGRRRRGRMRKRAQPLRLPVSQLDLRRPRRSRRPAARGRFPTVPRSAASLVELPVAERFGLVWAVPEPAAGFHWDAYFGPLAAELDGLGYDGAAASPHELRFAQPSNWKLVLDANLESYHFQYAHRATIAHLFHDNLVQQASFGRHQRIVLAKRSIVRGRRRGAGSCPDVGAARPALQHHLFHLPGDLPALGGRPRQRLLGHARHARRRAPCASWMLVPGRTMHAARPSTGAATGRCSGTRSTRTSRSPPRCSAASRAAPTGA